MVVDAFVEHGTGLRSKSFGAQYQSLQRIDRNVQRGRRTSLFLELLDARGGELERYNDFRDHFIEHVHPNRSEQQPRPVSGLTALAFVSDPAGPSPLTTHRITGAGPGWVSIRAGEVNGRPVEVVLAHKALFVGETGDEHIELDPEMAGHFRSMDPHHHWYVRQGPAPNELNERDQGLTIVGDADLQDVQDAVLTFVEDLLTRCREAE